MKPYSRILSILFSTICTLSLICAVSASETAPGVDTQFCFSSDDFALSESDNGIFITSVPQQSDAQVFYGNRLLQAGDALTPDALDQLTVYVSSLVPAQSSIKYHIISAGKSVSQKELALSILPKKNEPPTASDSQLETYRNIANTGTLSASDPENGVLAYQIVTEPKRGTVELHEDGTFTYTPNENKVGKDSFSFTVTDDAGQTSSPAKVSIEIKKPSDKRVYADLTDDDALFTAMWMKEEGLFSGTSIAGNLCFCPDNPVSRGEFLVMAMQVVGAEADQMNLHSGFADESATPVWMQPYIVSALSNGMISGSRYDDQIVFRPNETLTQAEAAMMLQNILQLPGSSVQEVISMDEDSSVPVWAETAAAALFSAGIELDLSSESAAVTRRDTARMLYQVNRLLEQDSIPTFYWAQ